MNTNRIHALVRATVVVVFLVALFAPIFSWQRTEALTPKISLSSTSGAPGDVIRLNGGNFPVTSSGSLFWGDHFNPLAMFKSGQSGQVSSLFTVPDVPPGEYEIHSSAGPALASVNFTVTEGQPTQLNAKRRKTPTPANDGEAPTETPAQDPTQAPVKEAAATETTPTKTATTQVTPEKSITLTPVADAFVSADTPAQNFGADPALKSDREPMEEGFLRFDVSGTGGVSRAVLRVYMSNGSGSTTEVYGVAKEWDEKTVTWDTRPNHITDRIVEVATAPVNSWVEYDVSSLITGDGTFNLSVTNPHRDGIAFSSREGGRAPELIIESGASSEPTVAISPTTPATSTPAPTNTAPAPTNTAPAPTNTAPAPTNTAPAPTNTAPASGGSNLTPTATKAAPTATTAAPTATAPAAKFGVTIDSPANGTNVTSAKSVAIKVTATGPNPISKVEFYDNGKLAGTEDTDPFAYTWAVDAQANGTHKWTAKAFDKTTGASVTSTEVSVTVNVADATPGTAGKVTAAGETAPVPNSGDAADDPAIWIHPSDPSQSTIIGTDKLGGLAVYDLSGKQLYYYADSAPNNVDLRYNFPLGGVPTTLVVTSDRTTDAIRIYRVNPSTRGLEYIAARTISTNLGVAGITMYISPTTGKYYVFIGDNSGNNQQWELFDNGAGKVDARKVRTISISSTTEGMVADDGTGALYISQEDVALWRYSAEPDGGAARTQVAPVDAKNLTADIEGLAIYYGGPGYLIVSSQGSNDVAVYRRDTNAYVGRFQVTDGTVDAVSYTDGLDVTNISLGGNYASGLLVMQDDRNDSGNQNFKLIPWDRVAGGFSTKLSIDTGYDPRGVGGGGSSAPVPTATAQASATVQSSATPKPTSTATPKPTSTATPKPATATPNATGTPSSGGSTATTYYVNSSTGNDANAGTSTDKAWKSLTKVNSAALVPGDRVLFARGGSWTGKLTVSKSGTSGATILIGAYGSGNAPIVTGASSCATLSGSYLVLQDLQLTDCSWAGVEIAGSHNLVRRNIITLNVAGVVVKSGAVSDRVISNEIRDNNKMSVLTSGGNDDSGAFGVLLQGDKTEVGYNTITGSDAFSYDYGRDGAAVEIYGATFSDIHHNLAKQNDAFTELGKSTSSDNTYAYNVVISSLETSIFVVTRGSGSSYGPITRTTLYNNTVYLTGAKSQGFVCSSGCSSTILRMRNNIIQAVWKVGYADNKFDEDSNLYFGGIAQFTMGANSKIADPKFTNPGGGDLTLTASSPAIDKGVDVGYSADFAGNGVPKDGNGDGNAKPDMGAYEY